MRSTDGICECGAEIYWYARDEWFHMGSGSWYCSTLNDRRVAKPAAPIIEEEDELYESLGVW